MVELIVWHLIWFAIIGVILWVILDRLDHDGHLPWSDASDRTAGDK